MGQGDQCAASLALEHPLDAERRRTVSVGYEDLAIYRLLARASRWSSPTTPASARPTGCTPTSTASTRPTPLLDAARAARAVDGSVRHRRLTRRHVRIQPGRRRGSRGGRTATLLRSRRRTWPAHTPAHRPPTWPRSSRASTAAPWPVLWAGRSTVSSSRTPPSRTDRGRQHQRDGQGRTRRPVDDVRRATRCSGTASARARSGRPAASPSADIVAAEPELRATLDKQRIGRLKPAGPVRLATGVQDDIVRTLRPASSPSTGATRAATSPTSPSTAQPRRRAAHEPPRAAPRRPGRAVSWLTDRLVGQARRLQLRVPA